MTSPAEKARIGAYEIISRLDAHDRELYYAVKGQRRVILALYELPTASRRALQVEVERSQQLQHEAIVPIIDCFISGAQQVLVYETIEGLSLLRLNEALTRNDEQLPEGAALHIGAAVMGALAAAHASKTASGARKSMVHGELGPHQIFITWDGQPKVLGIGLSSIFALAIQHDRIPDCARPFIAPEVLDNKPMTPRSNAYSAALLIWSLLSGEPLPPAGERIKSLKKLRPDIPGAVTLRLDQTLTHSPRARMSCGLLAKTLERTLKDEDRNILGWTMEMARARISSNEPLPMESLPPTSFDESQQVKDSVHPMSDDEMFDVPTAPVFEVPKHLQKLQMGGSSLPPPPQPDDERDLLEDDFGLSAIDAIMRPPPQKTPEKYTPTESEHAARARELTPLYTKPASLDASSLQPDQEEVAGATESATPQPPQTAVPKPTASSAGRIRRGAGSAKPSAKRQRAGSTKPKGSSAPPDNSFKKSTRISAGQQSEDVTQVVTEAALERARRAPAGHPHSERIESTSVTVSTKKSRPPTPIRAKQKTLLGAPKSAMPEAKAPKRQQTATSPADLAKEAVALASSESKIAPAGPIPRPERLPKVQIQLSKSSTPPPAVVEPKDDNDAIQPTHSEPTDSPALSSGRGRQTKEGPPPVSIEDAAPASDPTPAPDEAAGRATLLGTGAQPGLYPSPAYPMTVADGSAPSQYPGSMAPGSMAPGSIAPGSMAPGSIAPGSMAPGSYGAIPQSYGAVPSMGQHPMGPIYPMMGPHSMGPHSMGPHSMGMPHSMMHPGAAGQPVQPPAGWVPTRWVAITAVTAVVFFVLGMLIAGGGLQLTVKEDEPVKTALSPNTETASTAPPAEPSAAAALPTAAAAAPAGDNNTTPTATANAEADDAPAPSATAEASAAPAANDDALSGKAASLPPNSGYLLVETPYYPDGEVYWNGVHRGKVGEPLVVLCGAGFLRLGNAPLTRWFSDGQPVSVQCQTVSRVKIDQWRPANRVKSKPRPRKKRGQFLPSMP